MASNLPLIETKILEETGRLCAAWSYLEVVTEIALWGILELNSKHGPMVTSKADMRARWQMILDHAEKKHAGEMSALRKINKLLVDVARDRNIIVHGAINARTHDDKTFAQPPSWTIFRGQGAGKCYPVSEQAATTVRENIQKIAKMVADFNRRHHYADCCQPNSFVESGWPKPIE